MKDTPSIKAQERARLQRDRILDAAEQCFIEHGFHAASMASIATAARMSAGLIYRYFDNKNAIILAIIERQLAGTQADLATLQCDTDVAAILAQLFERWRTRASDMMNPVLFLEMTAQASRDPQIADALHSADKVSNSELATWLQRVGQGESWGSAEDVRVRTLVLRCFMEGLAVRAVREPDMAPELIAASVQLFVRQLLPGRAHGNGAVRP